MASQPPHDHRWYTPADCAAILLAVKHGNGYRAPCPVHGGDSTDALHIWESTDRYGHPKTSLHCHAHQCAIDALCAAMGIEVRNLYSIQPAYAKTTRSAPRAHSPRIDKLKHMEEPTPDDIIEAILCDQIAEDPDFITEGSPARAWMWERAQAHPAAREAFTTALKAAGIHPGRFWTALAVERQ